MLAKLLLLLNLVFPLLASGCWWQPGQIACETDLNCPTGMVCDVSLTHAATGAHACAEVAAVDDDDSLDDDDFLDDDDSFDDDDVLDDDDSSTEPPTPPAPTALITEPIAGDAFLPVELVPMTGAVHSEAGSILDVA